MPEVRKSVQRVLAGNDWVVWTVLYDDKEGNVIGQGGADDREEVDRVPSLLVPNPIPSIPSRPCSLMSGSLSTALKIDLAPAR